MYCILRSHSNKVPLFWGHEHLLVKFAFTFTQYGFGAC